MEFKEVEKLLEEADRFLRIAFEEFNRGLEEVKPEARDVKLRGSAEKAWNAIVKATEALLVSRGYALEEIKTYRMKRLKLEELAARDGTVKKLELRDRFAAREYNLHIRCFYDGEYTVEGLREELEKAREYIELVRRTLATPHPFSTRGAYDRPSIIVEDLL